MVWVTMAGTLNKLDIEILLNTYADHYPILLTICGKKKYRMWRLNSAALKKPEILEKVKEEMDWFF